MTKRNIKNVSDKEIRDLVIARIRSLSGNKKISIGSDGEFSKDELVKRIQNGDSVGDKIIEIQLSYLKSLKEGLFLNE